MRKRISTIAWLVLGLLGFGYLFIKTPLDTLGQVMGQMNIALAVAAVLLYGFSQVLLAGRWMLLLRVHDVHVPFFRTVGLTFLGLFYNNVMPGAVGGDLLKAWYIRHHAPAHSHLQAVVTVFVDRLVGLVGMILVGAIAGLFVGGDLGITVAGHYVPVRMMIWIIFGGLMVAAIVFLSRRIRRLLFLNQILERLPFAAKLRQIDEAIRMYRHHPALMLLSLAMTAVVQGMAIVAIWILCRSLHLDSVRFIQVLLIMPIVWLISSAIPVPGGLGVIENLFIPFFSAAISPNDPAASWALASASALALLNRLMIVAISIPGGVVPLFGGHLPKVSELTESADPAVATSPDGCPQE